MSQLCMDINLNAKLSHKYKKASQKIRVISESWVLSEVFCPGCGGNIEEYQNNKPVADFYCKKCTEDFELKSKKNRFGKSIPAGSYSKMIQRISSPQKPNFFFMAYLTESWRVDSFFVIPKHFFSIDVIEKRKPLSQNARRAGWVGSNILFSKIPNAGKIYYIKDGVAKEKSEVMSNWQKTIFLKKIKKEESKGWILDIMKCIDELDKKEFTLQEMYRFEEKLSSLYPDNKNIKPKIRQQLQFLRDKGYLEFIEAGKYRLT